MIPHNGDDPGTQSPIDVDDLLGAVVDCGTEVYDTEDRAAGQRIADRLTERWMHAAPEVATVTAIDAVRMPVLTVPAWTAHERAAASGISGPMQSVIDLEFGIQFVRSAADGDETAVSVKSFGDRVGSDDIVRIEITSGHERSEVLLVLYTGADNHPTGEIATRAITMSEDLAIAIIPTSSLTADHATAVTQAVRSSRTAGRNAWRRIAKGLPDDHPVRIAVMDGLR